MENIPTQDEIVERILERRENDILCWELEDFYSYLDYEHVKQFLKKDIKKSDINASILLRDNIIKQIKEYMPFAIEKMEDERGISAERSICHFIGWTWLAGDKDLSNKIADKSKISNDYGRDILKMICKFYNIDNEID